MFSKSLMKKIESNPQLKELDRGMETYLNLNGFKRVILKDGSAKIARMTKKEKKAVSLGAKTIPMGIELKRIRVK